ncbi:hypothetical protein [Aureimonas psammosilenae]|uniref:hypothetical protein n=1 Tax=Aureimonas psammosilenae TaxID=2495496 RepID=UPI001260D4CA|nr:hypothetical protein [Aureimonas psammosilenae]
MSDEPTPIKVEIELMPWQVEAIQRWRIPEELCGPSLIEKVEWLLDDCALRMVEAERDRERNKLYRTFGLKHPHDHSDEGDEVPF